MLRTKYTNKHQHTAILRALYHDFVYHTTCLMFVNEKEIFAVFVGYPPLQIYIINKKILEKSYLSYCN